MEYLAEGSRVALRGEGGNGGTFPTIPSVDFHADGSPQFNHVNGLQLIARAHQLVNEGYKVRSSILIDAR
jgi:diadenosine tetraphosphatase ApaH/serine/threonine PP2A family protein phosphatase